VRQQWHSGDLQVQVAFIHPRPPRAVLSNATDLFFLRSL
jgi:hypothetical protein